jgi:hypothetical protein
MKTAHLMIAVGFFVLGCASGWAHTPTTAPVGERPEILHSQALTTTIDGRHMPSPLLKPKGEITLDAPQSRRFAAAQTVKQRCVSVCRTRYRSCLSLRQIPFFECQWVYEDCTRYTCNGFVD